MTARSGRAGELRRGLDHRRLRRGCDAGRLHRAGHRALPDPVSVTLPGGEEPSFPLVLAERDRSHGRAAVRKDAGDDPDVTHGALVESWVRPAPPGAGIVFRAGEGVGIVTRPGLSLAVGEPAINPAPRKMIAAMLNELAPVLGGPADVSVTIGIPDGRRLAQRTMNGRLGIVGGLSVLGTSGIVKPYSLRRVDRLDPPGDRCGCRDRRHPPRGGDGPGLGGGGAGALRPRRGRADRHGRFRRRHPEADPAQAGAAAHHRRRFGKISKLADGHMDLHSARSSVDRAGLIRRLAALGAPDATLAEARTAGSAAAILEIATETGLPLADAVAAEARAVADTALAAARLQPPSGRAHRRPYRLHRWPRRPLSGRRGC